MKSENNNRTTGLILMIGGVIWLIHYGGALVFYLLGDPDKGRFMSNPLFLTVMTLTGAALIWYGRKLRPAQSKDFE